MVRCPFCAKENDPAVTFCLHCGNARSNAGKATEALSTAVQYEPAVIHKCAERLYALAGLVVPLLTLLGVIHGVVVGLPIVFAGNTSESPLMMLLGVGSMVFSAGCGWLCGLVVALGARFHAHLILCLVAIESNTRSRI